MRFNKFNRFLFLLHVMQRFPLNAVEVSLHSSCEFHACLLQIVFLLAFWDSSPRNDLVLVIALFSLAFLLFIFILLVQMSPVCVFAARGRDLLIDLVVHILALWEIIGLSNRLLRGERILLRARIVRMLGFCMALTHSCFDLSSCCLDTSCYLGLQCIYSIPE